MLWEVDIYPADGQPDLLGRAAAAAAAELGLARNLSVAAARGYLIQGDLDRRQIERIAGELLTDRIVERTVAAPVGDAALIAPPRTGARLVHVLPKPGVMDPVAQSVVSAIADFGFRAEAVRTLKKYWIVGAPEERLGPLASKVLANDAIEQVVVGPLAFRRLEVGSPYEFRLTTVSLGAMDDAALERLSLEGQLYLSLVEMQTIQAHFRSLGRDPSDVELETIAQTWSEHCSHKTLDRPDSLPRRRRRAAIREHAPGDDLRRDGKDSPRRPAATTGASASFATTPAWSASTSSTTSSSRSRRTTILRPWSRMAGPTRAWAA